MRQTRWTAFPSLALAAGLIALAAAPLSGQSLPHFEDQIVVTGAGAGTTVARVPAFVTLLDVEDILASPARNIADLLRQAGVQVTDITGNGRSYRVDLRGFGATAGLNTLVLVDGRRVNQPDLSGTDWSQIPISQVARIEVIRGGRGAVVYGDNAAGGVVNIVTRSGADPETRLAARAGAFRTIAPEASSRGERGRVSYAVSGSYNVSDGHRVNADTEGGDVAGRIAVRPGGAFELGVSGAYHHDKTGLPGSLTETALGSGVEPSDSVTPNDFSETDDTYVMATPQMALGSQGRVLVDLSIRQRDSLAFSTFVGGEFSGDTRTTTRAASPRVEWAVSGAGAAHRFVAGADLFSSEQGIVNTVVLGGIPDTGFFTLEKSGRAAYVRDEVTAGAATISAGYRYDAATYRFTPSTPSSREFSMHAADAGATFVLSDAVSVFAGVSRSFRYPVLDELFDFFGNTIVGTLDPQSSIDVEGGVRVASGTMRASATVFRLATDDEIFFNRAAGFGFGANENLDGTGRRTGLEVAVSMLVAGAEIGGTLAIVRTSIDGGAYDGESMPGVAGERATVLLRVPISGRLSLGLEGAYTGTRRFEGDFAGMFGTQEAFFVLDARVAYRQGRTRLFVDLKNLLDQEFNEYGVIGGFPTQRAYYPSPGVHVLTGVDVTF